MTNTSMSDTTITKIGSRHSPHGALGQKYLASGVTLALRLWEEATPGELGPLQSRPYETVGDVIR